MMAVQKPWLCALVLDKFGRQLAATGRTAQRKLEQAAGKRAFSELFAQADKLVIAIKDAVSDAS